MWPLEVVWQYSIPVFDWNYLYLVSLSAVTEFQAKINAVRTSCRNSKSPLHLIATLELPSLWVIHVALQHHFHKQLLFHWLLIILAEVRVGPRPGEQQVFIQRSKSLQDVQNIKLLHVPDFSYGDEQWMHIEYIFRKFIFKATVYITHLSSRFLYSIYYLVFHKSLFTILAAFSIDIFPVSKINESHK